MTDVTPEGAPRFGPTTEIVLAWLSTYEFAADDPRTVMERVLLDLAQEWDERHAPAVAGLMRQVTGDIARFADEPATPVDEIRARYAEKMARLLTQRPPLQVVPDADGTR